MPMNRKNLATLLLSVSLLGASHFAYSQTISRDQLSRNLRLYAEKRDVLRGDAKTQMIIEFQNQRYDEVLTLAKNELTREVNSQSPDLLNLYAWMEVIKSIGTPNDARILATLKKRIEMGESKISPNTPDGQAARSLLEETREAMVNNDPSVIPSLSATTQALTPAPRGLGYETIKDLNTKILKNDDYAVLAAAMEFNLSNQVLVERQKGIASPIRNRTQEIEDASNVLVRMNSRVPLVMGESGVGKTSVVRGLVENIIDGKLPEGIHTKELQRSIVIQTSAAKLQGLAEAQLPKYEMAVIRAFFNSVRKFEQDQKVKVIVVMEGAHRLSEAQIDAMKPYLTSTTAPVNLVLVSNAQQASLKLLGNPELSGQVELVSVAEFDEATTFNVIKRSHLAQIESHYKVQVPDAVLTDLIEVSREIRPDLRRPVGPIKILQDVAIEASKNAKGQEVTLTKKDLFAFAAKKMKMPIVPQDREAFLNFMNSVKLSIKTEVRGQDPAVDQITDLLAETMTSKGKRSRAAIMVGTTGTGKTMIAKSVAKQALGSDERVLEIDMNQLKSDDSGNYLFGPKAGYIGSDKNKGILTEFIDKNGSGTIIIIVNEIEKGHPSQIERLMEVLDTNGFTPGDGRPRTMPRTLWIGTSNQGATNFFPSEFLKTATREQIDGIIAKTTSDDVKNAFLQPTSLGSNTMKPEVLARFDRFILQAPVLKDTAIEIAALKANSQIKHYQSQDLGDIKVDSDFSKVFAEEVYDPAGGVRELERRVRSEVDKLYNEHLKKYGSSKTLNVVTNPPAPGTENVTFTVTNERGQELIVQGPKFAYQNPLFNPVLKNKLRTLEADLKLEVFGQDAYAQKLAAGLRDAAVDLESPRPASFYVTGGTGMGKTEMVRVATRLRYGSEEFLLKLDMGMVKDVKDLSNIFQPAQGYVGSDQPGQFERFLQSHKEGFVLLDEMGNAGGKDPTAKEEIGKYFYSILDDGVWVSPVTKRTYNLKNYTFVFTGNEAEVLFKGYSQDDMLRAIWKDNSAEDKARALLTKSGLSPAFLGRINGVIITEPPVLESKVKIATKLINDWKKRMESKQPIQIVFDDQFITQVSKLVYSASEGGRSVVNFVKTTLGAATSSGLFEIDYEKATAENPAQVRLSLETKAPARPFYEVKPDETLAKLHVEIVQGGKTIYEGSSDFTSSAKFMKQIKKTDAIKTAFHEAGHAVTNDPRISGSRLDHLTIIPADHYLGYARYEDIPGFTTNYSRSNLLARLITLVAGSEAELLVGGEVNSGQAGDLAEERELLTKAAIKWGLVPELQGVQIDAEGKAHFTARQEEIFEKFASELLTEAREAAKKSLEENWYLVSLVSRELIQKGEISGARYEELVKKAFAATPDFKEKFFLNISPQKVAAKLKFREGELCNLILGK